MTNESIVAHFFGGPVDGVIRVLEPDTTLCQVKVLSEAAGSAMIKDNLRLDESVDLETFWYELQPYNSSEGYAVYLCTGGVGRFEGRLDV